MVLLHITRLLCVGCCSLFLFTSCHNDKTPKMGECSAERLVRLNLRHEPLTMDPRKGGDVISSQMHFLLFEGLVKLNPDRSIAPALAESFTVSEDGLIYTFRLRDTCWSDGSPVLTSDFEAAWKMILSPSFPSPNAHLLYPIKNAERAKKGEVELGEIGIASEGEKTLLVTLEKPTPYFLDLISFCVFFPVSSQNDQNHPEWARDPGEHFLSNGPFLLQEWKHHDEILLVKNPLYWDHTRVLPDKIHFSMVDNEATVLQMFENGSLDMIGDPLSSISTDALSTLKQKGLIQKYSIPATTMVAFNAASPFFSNPKIRKAFSYAIHRESIANITQMDECIATSAVPPILKKGIGRLQFFQDGNDHLAQKLFEEGLRESGLSREAFSNLSYYYATTELNHKIAQALQQQWRDTLGVEIKLENFEHKILLAKFSQRDYHIGQVRWMSQYNDTMSMLERFKSKDNPINFSNWEHPLFAQLLEASFYETGAQRFQTLERAEEILMEEMPFSPIYHWDMTYMVQPGCKNLGISSIGELCFEDMDHS